MKMEFQIKTDNTQQIIAEKNEAVLRALEIIGQVVENSAAGYAPVDTGNLRNSITHEVDDGEHCVYIGSNVEYAPYQELGTNRMKAANGGRGFLRPAVEDNMEKIQSIFKEELSQ
jgi:HK97 gp10 family phage protein